MVASESNHALLLNLVSILKKCIQSFGNDLVEILRIPIKKRPFKSKSGFVIFVESIGLPVIQDYQLFECIIQNQFVI